MENRVTPPAMPDWELVRVIGHGNYGTVYEIQRDIAGDTDKAALKVIRIPQNDSEIQELRSSGYDDASITARLRSYLNDIVDEYKIMARLKGHRNIVFCEDVQRVQHGDGFGWDIFIKMELLTPILTLPRNHFTEPEVIRMGIDICRALEECWNEHVIHRDILISKEERNWVDTEYNWVNRAWVAVSYAVSS